MDKKYKGGMEKLNENTQDALQAGAAFDGQHIVMKLRHTGIPRGKMYI